MKAQAASQANGSHKPPTPPALEPTNDTDPAWCPIHRCKMERRQNERGSWYSHRLQSGAYCKGEVRRESMQEECRDARRYAGTP
jgi:hypothetical protein